MLSNIAQPFTFLRGLITKGSERSVNIKKNILVLLVIRGCSIVTSFVSLPLTLHYINPTRYGIWLTLSSIIGWFTFFDIGFGNGLRNRFAESVAKGEHKLARTYVSTTYAVLSIIVAAVLLLFFAINPFLNWSKILNAPGDMASELSLVALTVFVFFCFQFVLQLITTLLTANQQPAKASFYNFMGSLLSLVVIFILTKTTSGKLIYLGLVFGASPVLILLISSAWFYSHQYKKYAPSLRFVKFRYARNLMTIGIKFFFIQIAFIVLYQTSNIIIAQLFGPTEVTPYNIVYKYFGIITMVSGIIMMPFWSAFTEAWIKSDIQWIKQTLRKLKIWWVLIATFTVLMCLFSPFVYKFWVGPEIKIPWTMSIVMAAYVIINAWNGIYSQFLNGVGKIKLQLYSGLWGMVLNIPLAIFLAKAMGVAGVILSTVFLGIINMVWGPIQAKKLINNNARGIWNQ